jgi:ATP-dependent RNA helicase DDX55/SPB4
MTDKRDEREKRRGKKAKKRQAIKDSASKEDKVCDDGAQEDMQDIEEDGDDWDEMAREERMAKKVKRGRVDKSTFEKAFGLDDL